METIRELSQVYSHWSNMARSPDCKSPLYHQPQSADEIESKLLKQFGIIK